MKDKIKIKPAITPAELRVIVEKYVVYDSMSYTEAICEICKEREIDPEDMSKIIKGPLKEKLEAEAMKLNIIKRTTEYLL